MCLLQFYPGTTRTDCPFEGSEIWEVSFPCLMEFVLTCRSVGDDLWKHTIDSGKLC